MHPVRPPHLLIREHGGGGTLDRHLANGTQGRLISWHPEKPDKDKKALLASHPDLTARFVKEGSVSKSELVADIDFIDVAVRQENLTTIPGMPVMVQMPLQPCYGLTIHKTQALSTVDWRRDALCLHSVRRAKQATFAPSGSNISSAGYSKASSRRRLILRM